MQPGTLQDVIRLSIEFNSAVKSAYPILFDKISAGPAYEQNVLKMAQNVISSGEPSEAQVKQIINLFETNAEYLKQILPRAEIAKLIPAGLKEPKNVEKLRQLGAKNLAGLSTLKP